MDTRPDSAASAALGTDVRWPIDFVFLDIDGDPIRVTNAPYPVSFAGTGDEDLDGFTFTPLRPDLVSVGPVQVKETGTDTVTLTLSGLPLLDDELMTELGDKARYQERDARMWKAMLHPQDLTRIGAIWSYYTGYMNAPKVTSDRGQQTITLEVESFLGFFDQASNSTYLDQVRLDPGDRSADLAIAIANGASNRK